MEAYERTLKEILFPKVPTIIDEIKHCHRLAKDSAIEVFKKKALGDVQGDFFKEFSKKIKIIIN